MTTGRLDTMNNHLLTCQFVPLSVKEQAAAFKSESVTEAERKDEPTQSTAIKHNRSESSSSNQLRQRLAKKQKTFEIVAVKARPFTETMQRSFENQLLKAFVSSGTAFNKIDDPEVQRLFAGFLPSVVVPTRQRLESEVLRHVVVQAEGEIKNSVKGCYATLSCDGWKDVSRRHLVAFMLTVNRQVSLNYLNKTRVVTKL